MRERRECRDNLSRVLEIEGSVVGRRRELGRGAVVGTDTGRRGIVGFGSKSMREDT